MLEKAVLAAISALIGGLSGAVTMMLSRRRTRAINATRTLSLFFFRHLSKLDAGHSLQEKEVSQQIVQWLEYPNSLGSEAGAAKLVAMVQVLSDPSDTEISEVDRALNYLDQRATERDRKGDER